MKYKLILFDADETLFDFKKTEKYALGASMTHLGIGYEESVHLPIYKQVNGKIWKELEDGLITQSVLKIERFRRFSEALDIAFDAEEFSRLYTDFLAQGSFLLEGAMEVIQQIYDGHDLMIITNGLAKVQNHRIRQSDIAKYFEAIIISEEIGVAKPSEKIFEHALETYGHIDKDRILMVGDSLRSDIQGGINFGIDTCWFNPRKKENTEGIMPTYQIETLKQLSGIIG